MTIGERLDPKTLCAISSPNTSNKTLQKSHQTAFIRLRVAALRNTLELPRVPYDFHNAHTIHRLDACRDGPHAVRAVSALQQCNRSIGINSQ